ncbi:MAG: hypothetical protein AVDCRST_MAG05-3925, partial [uncultured Rubrobacteraceae bacterium]
ASSPPRGARLAGPLRASGRRSQPRRSPRRRSRSTTPAWRRGCSRATRSRWRGPRGL